MIITKLETSNVRKLTAVQIEPDGSLVLIGGKNAAGKSSVLDSIAYALGGKTEANDRPVRDGATHSDIVCELGEPGQAPDLIVRRRISADGNWTLHLENPEGARFKSPQSKLDRLWRRRTLDPLAFAQMEPKKQLETLREITGLDFSEFESERARLYEERRDVNVAARQLEGQLSGLTHHEDAPAELVSGAELFAERDALVAKARENEQQRERAEQRARDAMNAAAAVSQHEKAVAEARAALKRAEEALARAEQEAGECRAVAAAAAQEVSGLTDPDLAPIEERIASLDETNWKVRENASRLGIQKALGAEQAKSKALGEAIAAVDEKKAAAIAAVEMPIDGLGFAADCVLLNGIPFSEASQAEKLQTSVAIGLAMNPEIRVLLIRDGSLLDSDHLRMIGEAAAAAKAQLWVEVVREDAGDDDVVMIEDGHRAEAAALAAVGE